MCIDRPSMEAQNGMNGVLWPVDSNGHVGRTYI